MLFIVLERLTTKEDIVELNDVPVACKMGPLVEEIFEREREAMLKYQLLEILQG
jgi:hypothetical protein